MDWIEAVGVRGSYGKQRRDASHNDRADERREAQRWDVVEEIGSRQRNQADGG
jgi:hypothetical protein